MRPFEYISPRTLDEATQLFIDSSPGAKFLSGGTDLLSEIKDGIERPDRLISLADLCELRGITCNDTGVRLGAALTLAGLSDDQLLMVHFPVLVEAANTIATPQIRNVATLGGNLCQRPRCWYYRHPLFPCYKKGGSICYAPSGYNRNLAIFDGGLSFIVHPSDMAPALIAMDARLGTFGPRGHALMPLEEFFVSPGERQLQENVLQLGEFITHVDVPWPKPNTQGVYLKARERSAEDFASASVAVVLTAEHGIVDRVRIVLGGVAAKPRRVTDVESMIVGRRIRDLDFDALTLQAVHGAKPLTQNEHKVSLIKTLVCRALEFLS